jgi:leukotriene-A4 hydrolase
MTCHLAARLLAICAAVLAPVLAGGAAAVDADPHSYSEPAHLRVRHVDLALDVDFAARRLSGTVDLTVQRLDPAATELVLDTRDLLVRGAWRVTGERVEPLPFRVGPRDAVLGSPLAIEIGDAGGSAREFVVRVSYQTSPDASGLQWLEPAQTAGRAQPFLYSQSQSIHARSWIPLQDSPQVRVTYHATIRTPAALRAVMSAVNDPAAARDGRFEFDMREPIPPYLIALAVGDLDFRATGPRSGVYAEPATLARAAWEFAEVESMMQACERLFGPYRWGRYDLLVLPPSFPFGGMENPKLTFVTPTVIAGDRSLVSLIAHELAHSWSGNLVTNATWNDFWLNEGFTVYIERRILEAVYGRERERQEAALGLEDLRHELAELPASDQVLALDLRGRDPDDGTTDVAYEKGALFLSWLEERFGREVFDAFLRGYFDRFAFQSVTTTQFRDWLTAHLLASHAGRVSAAEIDAWIHSPGLPAFAVLPATPAFAAVDAARAAWLAGTTPAAQLPVSGWSVQQWQRFLDGLPPDVPAGRLAELDAAHGFTRSGNSEIAFSWFRDAIRAGYAPAYPALEQFLLTVGRRKFIRPLYQALMATADGAAFARRVYTAARPGYHPIARASLDPIVLPAPR